MFCKVRIISTELPSRSLLSILPSFQANIWWTRNIRNVYLKSNPILEVAAVTLVTVIVSFTNPWTKMGGTELVSLLVSECHREESSEGLCIDRPELVFGLLKSLGFALVMKAFLTVITFGIKLPGQYSGVEFFRHRLLTSLLSEQPESSSVRPQTCCPELR